MKKALLILLTLLMVASLATAQGVKIGGWGRGFLEIAGSTTANQNPMIGPVIGWWTDNGPRIGINIIGTSENVGFQIDMNIDGGAVNLGDQGKIWVKPISQITVQLGYSTYDDALRGNASFGIFNWIRMRGWQGTPIDMPGDGFIFQRAAKAQGANGDSAGGNFELAIDPIEGLHAFVVLTPGTGISKDLQTAILSNAMYGAGYTIAGIGQIRAQWLELALNGGAINAAFKLTAVSGLTVDLGTYVFMTDGQMGNIFVNLFGSYAVMPTLTLNLIGSFAMIKATAPATDYMAIYGGIEGEYALPMDLVATVDVRVQTNTSTNTAINWLGWGAMIAIQKNFSNGLMGIGFEVTNIGFAGSNPLAPWAADGKLIGWAVPIRLEYWF